MSTSLDVISAPETRQRLDRAAWVGFIVLLVVTSGSLLAVILLRLPVAVMAILPLVLVLVWVLRKPSVGLYLLLAATLLIPSVPLRFADSTVDSIPFFLNLSDPATVNLSGIGITPAEILMLVTLVGLLAAVAATRQSLPAGRLMVPYLIFGLVVAVGELNGLARGGDFKLSLWELRPQVYGLVVFVMATQLIREKSQIKILLAILLGAEVIKGLVGDYRYFITLGRQLGNLEAIQAHEESYLLGLFLLAMVIGLIWFRSRVRVLLVVLSPIAFTAIVVNHRRAGLLALGLEIVAVMVMAYIVETSLRGRLLKAGVVMGIVGVAFLAAFWNQQYGSIAEVIRPIKSLFVPSARDLSSDLYRIAESANLKATFRSSPLVGIGFGHPYYIAYPQPGVAKFDPLWNVIPHNTLLWIPMRMGVVGLIAFWSLISMAILEAIWAIRAIPDKFLRATVVFALATIFGGLFIAYVDVGLESYRNMIVLGLMLALINRVPELAREQEQGTTKIHA